MFKNRVGIFVVMLFLIGFFSCDNNNSKYILSDKVIEKGEIIDFELSKELSTKFIQFQYYDSKIFCLNNMNDTSIYIFNLKGKQIGTLRYKRKGPNGVGNISGFYIHNYDSVFLLYKHAYRLFLVDSCGNVNNLYHLLKEDNKKMRANTAMPYLTGGGGIKKRNNFLYIPAVPDQEPFVNDYKYENLLIKLNLDTKEINYQLGFPESYKKYYIYGAYTVVAIAQTGNDSCMLISHLADYNLYVYNYITDKLRIVNRQKCSFLDNVVMPKKLPPPPHQEKLRMLQMLQVDKYVGIYYDKYKNMYYRFAVKGVAEVQAKSYLKDFKKIEKKMFLMVYDKDFNLIAEDEINNMSSSVELFITEKGLYIKGDYKDEEDKVFFQQYIISDK